MKNLPKDRTVDQRLDAMERGTSRNFEHWEGQYRALVSKFNSLVKDLSDLRNFVDTDPTEEHDHSDAGEGGTVLASSVDHGGLSGLADDDHTQYATNTEFDDHSARHEDGGADEISIAGLAGTPAALTTHEADTSTHGVAEVAGVADITFETLDAAGDVGAGASTLAEGDHTHAGGSGHTIQDEGSSLTARTNLNFVGAGVTVTDDAGNDQTDVTISGGGSGVEVQEEDVQVLASATILDFDGDDFNITDEGSGEARIALAAGGGGVTAGAFVGASMYDASSPQNHTNSGGWQEMSFDSELFDTDAFHDTVTNNGRFTIPTGKAGKYLVLGRVAFATNATGKRGGRVLKNGTAVAGSPVIVEAVEMASASTIVAFSVIVDVAVGDYITVEAYQDSGGNLDINVSGNMLFQAGLLTTGVATPDFTGCVAILDGDVSISDASITQIAWDGVDEIDTDAFHDPASNNTRLTVPTGLAGKYRLHCTAGVGMASEATTGFMQVRIRLNGTTYLRHSGRIFMHNNANESPRTISVTAILELAEADYIEFELYQDTSGANLLLGPIGGTQQNTWAEMQFLGT